MTIQEFRDSDEILGKIHQKVTADLAAHYASRPGEYAYPDTFKRWSEHMETLNDAYADAFEKRMNLADAFFAEAFGKVNWENLLDGGQGD